MEDINFVEIKMNGNYHRGKQSPMKTLLKLRGNTKNMKKVSMTKRELRPHTNINNTKLTKKGSASNVNPNKSNLNLQNNKNVFMQNNENCDFNNNNIIIKKINIIKKKDKINKNISTNYLNDNNNNEESKKSGIIVKKIKNIKNLKNLKNKNLKTEENNENNEKNIKKIITIDNDNQTKKKIKIIYNKTNCDKNNNSKDSFKDNTNIMFFNSRLEISNKKEDKKNDYLTIKDNNNNTNNNNINNKKQIEIPDTNRNASCINFYNKYLKNNYNKKINTHNFDNNNNNINDKVINNYQYKNKINYVNNCPKYVYSTINNDESHSERLNLITNKSLENKKQNFPRNGNIVINTDNNNNIGIYHQKLLKKIIYSPKKGIYRVHSQGNVNSKQKEAYKTIDGNNNYIYKTKSVRDLKDLKDLTYSKKKCISNATINIDESKKYGIIDISDNSPSKNSDSKFDFDNLNEKKNNIRTIINYDNTDNIKEEKRQIKPYACPGIKIVLKAKKHRHNNNSVIVEHKYYNFDENEEYVDENNYEKRLTNIYRKFNKSNLMGKYKENFNNSTKNINSTDISNINKSIGYSNTNMSLITLSDTNLNGFLNNDIMNNKNLKTNINDTILSMNDLYNILIFEEKLKDIFTSLLIDDSNSEIISDYCFELINFFCQYSIDKSIKNIINDIIDQKNINIFNNHILLAVIIFYDAPSNQNVFSSIEIILKELLKLIYSNIIIVIKYTYSILKNLEKQDNKYVFELYDIINNILNMYIHNKDLYIEDSTYMLSTKNKESFDEDKFYSNINFIIRNIQIIMGYMNNSQNYNDILNIFQNINNISIEEISLLFKNKIMNIYSFNSSLTTSVILKNNSYQNKKKRIITPYIINMNNKKYTLILSLDDTIIHFKTNTIINNKGIMQIRPGLIEFFQNIRSYYEIIIFSIGNKKYTDAIIDSIDTNKKYIDYRLYQEHCIIINGEYVKDLSKIGRGIDKMVIVDNLPQNYRLQNDNGINIKSFYGDNPNDKVLYHLSKILISMAQNGGDIRKSIKKYWNEIVCKVCSNIYNNYCK